MTSLNTTFSTIIFLYRHMKSSHVAYKKKINVEILFSFKFYGFDMQDDQIFDVLIRDILLKDEN